MSPFSYKFKRIMKGRKSEKNKIVYIIPPKCVKLIKQRGPSCSENPDQDSSKSSSSQDDELEAGGWNWKGFTSSKSNSPDTPKKSDNKLLLSSTTPRPPISITFDTTPKPTINRDQTITPDPVITEPITAIEPLADKSTTEKSGFLEFFLKKSTTPGSEPSAEKFTQTTPTSKTQKQLPAQSTEESTTTSAENTKKRREKFVPDSTSKPTTVNTGQSTKATAKSTSTSNKPINTYQPTEISGQQTTGSTQKRMGRCFDWYDKIKDDVSTYPKIVKDPRSRKNCLKWYDLIKADGQTQSKSNASMVRKFENRKKSDFRCNYSMINRFDRWFDEKTGIEYLEPVFSQSVVPFNRLSQLITTRQISQKLIQGRHIFDQAIQEKIRTLKWLDSKITNQYEMLSRIDEISRSSRSIISSKRSNMRKMSKGRLSRKSNRAQRFRDEFIKKKLQRMNQDKNDGWWKNFNAKIYEKEHPDENFSLKNKNNSYIIQVSKISD